MPASPPRSAKIALVGIFFLLGVSAWLHVLLASAGAKNWLLLASRMWLEGRDLYVGVVEVNPPLILWLYALPVWVSLHVAWVKDFVALGLMGLAGVGLSVWICARLMRFNPVFAGDARMRLGFPLLLACVFVFFTSTSVFFDRDYILLLFTFPYALRFMPSLARQNIPLRLRCAIGLCAALGFCIKPHAAVIFIALQLLFVLREKSYAILWSVENRIVMLAMVGYFFCVWHFTPEYIHTILPMALLTYSAYSRGGSNLMYLPLAFFSMGLTFADFRLRYTTPYRRDIFYFIGLSTAFLIYAFLNNGWEYTYHPLFSLLLFLCVLVYLEYQWLKEDHEARGLPSKPFLFGQRGCVVSVGIQAMYMLLYLSSAGMTAHYVRLHCNGYVECRETMPYARYLQDHNIHSFGTITLDFPKWAMLVRMTDAQWDTRFNHLWMMAGLVKKGEGFIAAHRWIVDYVGGAYAEDLNGKKPEIVFVDKGRQFFAYPRRIDLVEFFSSVPSFKMAWQQYRYDSTIDECLKPATHYAKDACRYDIYLRVH